MESAGDFMKRTMEERERFQQAQRLEVLVNCLKAFTMDAYTWKVHKRDEQRREEAFRNLRQLTGIDVEKLLSE